MLDSEDIEECKKASWSILLHEKTPPTPVFPQSGGISDGLFDDE